MALKWTVVAAAAGAALAACPNQCSGHGSCAQNDICSCYENWQGSDCSQRTCAFGRSWGMDAADPHGYAECSGQGVCDRTTGECKCFSGFTGRACMRSKCPNDCSGNGECKLISDVVDSLAIPYSTTNWDASRIQTCVCDSGFFGPDCSQRYCPTGDDPLTLCASTHVSSYQEVRFALGSGVKWATTATAYTPGTYAATDEAMDYFGTGTFALGGPLVDQLAARVAAPGQMRLTYTDQFGGRYTAHAATNAFVSAAADAAANDALEAVLESLPEKKVKNVNVASKLTTSADASNPGVDGVLERRYVVTFVPDAANSANVGTQAPLGCDTGYSCTEAGCQPMVAMPFLYRYAGMAADVPLGTTLTNIGSAGAGHIAFYTGDRNTEDDWEDGQFVRVHASSQPQMPFNVPVDVGTSTGAPTTARYDLRILVAVIDPANSLNDDNDIAYVRVTAGHTNITSNMEAVGYAGWPAAPVATGVWGATSGTTPKPWTTTLTGFTPLGPIVADAAGAFKVAVPGAPGVSLHFPKADIVQSDGKGRWYEVLLKLPHCGVTVLEADGQFAGVDGAALHAVDAQVENAECSNRGACDRAAGRCACFEGYYGPACSKQTILV